MIEDIEFSDDWELATGNTITRERTRRARAELEVSVFLSEVPEREANGWRVVRSLVRKAILRKPKTIGVVNEDAWWVTFARMGFPIMSKGRNFKVPTEGESAAPQIDVLAMDEDTIFVIESKATSNSSRASRLRDQILKYSALRDSLSEAFGSIQKTDFRRRIVMVLASQNYTWSANDKALLKDEGILLVTEQELRYLSALAAQSPYLARNQLKAALLPSARIPRFQGRVPALRGREGNVRFYQFVIDPERLAKIAFIQHRDTLDDSASTTYQRLVSQPKLRSIASFVNNGGNFSTNLLINIRRRNLQFDAIRMTDQPSGSDDDLRFGYLHLPEERKTAWLIDGQHRLYGYFHPLTDDRVRARAKLMVTAYENLPADEEAQKFVEINNNQKSVSRGLLDELAGELFAGSDNPFHRMIVIRSKLATRLARSGGSPLFGRVQMEGLSSPATTVTFAELINTLRRSDLFGRVEARTNFIPGFFTRGTDDETVERAYEVVAEYLRYFERQASDHWAKERGRNLPGSPGGLLCTNRGVAGLIYMFEDTLSLLENGPRQLSLESESAESIVEAMEPYLNSLALRFRRPSSEFLATYQVHRGSTSGKIYSRQFESIVQSEFPEYDPDGLADYQRAAIEDIQQKIRDGVTGLGRLIQDVFFAAVHQEYPEDNWWPRVPQNRRQAIRVRQEAHDPNLEVDSYFELEDYKSISNNWGQPFTSLLSLEGESGLNWLTRMQQLARDGAAHFSNRSQGEEELRHLKDLYLRFVAQLSDNSYLQSNNIDLDMRVPALED